MTAKLLPKDRETKTLTDLKVGQSTWVVPWAIQVACDRSLWIQADYPIGDSWGGTSEVCLTKTKAGLTADARRTSHTWTVGDPIGDQCLPIVEATF